MSRIASFLSIVLFIVLLITLACISSNDKKLKNNEKDPRKAQIPASIDKNELRNKVKEIFLYIEKIILEGNFEKWYQSISNDYKKFLENEANLKQISKTSPYLKNRNIELKTAKDYFIHVVKASREEGPLKFHDCEMIDKNRVKVICFDKEDKLIYNFIFEDNIWKIDR